MQVQGQFHISYYQKMKASRGNASIKWYHNFQKLELKKKENITKSYIFKYNSNITRPRLTQFRSVLKIYNAMQKSAKTTTISKIQFRSPRFLENKFFFSLYRSQRNYKDTYILYCQQICYFHSPNLQKQEPKIYIIDIHPINWKLLLEQKAWKSFSCLRSETDTALNAPDKLQ